MVKKLLNPILLSAVFVAIFIYAKILPIQKNFVKNSLIDSNNITKIAGTIISNPVKISEKYYLARLKLKNVESNQNGAFIKSCANGIITLFIPVKIIEAFYPDKLFSRINKNDVENFNMNFLIEQGACFCANVVPLVSKKNEQNKNQNNIQAENSATLFLVEKIENVSFKNNFSGKVQQIRGLLRLEFKRLMSYWGNSGGLFLALISASKEYLNEELQNNFKFTGLLHILALSGMHLSMVSSILGFANNYTKLKKLYLIFQLFGIFIFVWFAGFSPSLLRSLISFSLIAFCKLFDVKSKNGLNILATTFLIHSIISPTDLENLGFMFSYAALLGIYIIEPFLTPFFVKIFPTKISNSLSTSCSANFFTAPISLKFFGMYSPIGIVCTMIISPLITIFIYCGISFLIINLIFPFSCGISKFIMNLIYQIIYFVVGFFKNFSVIKIY